MERNTASIYNGISFFFLVMTGIVVVFVIVRMMQPPPQGADGLVALPTPYILPTFTPSETPRPTLPPTFTNTPTDTPTPTNTETATPTIPPSPTITDTPGPTPTPSDTPTPEDTETPLPTATPIGPTPTFTPTDSPFFFELREDIFFGPNTVNAAGCAWQGVGGSVLDRSGVESTRPFQVRVFSDGVDRAATTGSNSLYGQFSGWEIPLENQISNRTYYVRLETLAGTQVSPDIQLTFPGDCNSNLAVVRFMQVREFGPQ